MVTAAAIPLSKVLNTRKPFVRIEGYIIGDQKPGTSSRTLRSRPLPTFFHR